MFLGGGDTLKVRGHDNRASNGGHEGDLPQIAAIINVYRLPK